MASIARENFSYKNAFTKVNTITTLPVGTALTGSQYEIVAVTVAGGKLVVVPYSAETHVNGEKLGVVMQDNNKVVGTLVNILLNGELAGNIAGECNAEFKKAAVVNALLCSGIVIQYPTYA
ncbi:MAG: hypothetical protein ACRCTW_07665 [Lactococcus garvieae]